MIPKNPVKLSTVEEDFKRIGLIKEDEDAPETVEVPGHKDVPGTKEDNVKKADAKSDKGDDKADAPKADKGDEKSEGWKARVKSKTSKMQNEGWKARVKSKITSGQKHLNMGLDTVSGLIDDVKTIVNKIDMSERSEMIRSFAQLAIIAETVANRFHIVSKHDADFSEPAAHLTAMAETAAAMAEGLHGALAEGADFDLTKEQIDENFKGMMSDLLEGLEVYNALSALAEEDEDDKKDDADDKKPAFLKKGEKKDGDDSEKEPDGDEDGEKKSDKDGDEPEAEAGEDLDVLKGADRARGFNQDDKSPEAYGAAKGAYESKVNPR